MSKHPHATLSGRDARGHHPRGRPRVRQAVVCSAVAALIGGGGVAACGGSQYGADDGSSHTPATSSSSRESAPSEEHSAESDVPTKPSAKSDVPSKEDAPASEEPSTASSDDTDTSTEAPSETESPGEEDAPATDEGTDGPAILSLTDTATSENGVAVSLSHFTRAVTGADEIPEKTPYVKFTVTVKNGTDSAIDLPSELTLSCSSGNSPGEEVFADGANEGTGFTTSVLPGRSASAVYGCTLPSAEKHLQVEITPTFDMEIAIFSGDVQE